MGEKDEVADFVKYKRSMGVERGSWNYCAVPPAKDLLTSHSKWSDFQKSCCSALWASSLFFKGETNTSAVFMLLLVTDIAL